MRRIYATGGQIIRPWGYDLRPGDKGYWDFGPLNDPGYRPPEQVEPYSEYWRAEADVAARQARYGDDW